jgi:pimeloyl-ACP methyl ester carboxylesterase
MTSKGTHQAAEERLPASNLPGPSPTPHPDAVPKGHIGWVVAGSLATGCLAALLLVAAPFVPVEESAVTGAVLCGFATGWAMLAVLSERLTDQPQRWAAAPALLLALGGLVLLGIGEPARATLSWVWPPAMLAAATWMALQAHRRLRSRSRHWLLYPVIAVLAVASIGGGYETVRAATDASAYPMPGQLLDVGGHRLHLSCTGAGSPTVVLEAGGGEMSSNLAWIVPVVSRGSRVCVYDRAGRGWSEPAAAPQDGAQIATDLHTLLQRGNIPGPYVLAGHSFGGLYALTFAAHYPDEVAGMVLVDTTPPASPDEPRKAAPRDAGAYDPIGRLSTLVSTAARLGLGRLFAQSEFGSLAPRAQAEVRASLATAGHLRSTIDEYVQATASMQQAAALRDLADKPLVVLTAGSGSDAAWIANHEGLAALSTNSVHRVIDGATHQTLIADEHDSAATTRAILDAVSSARNSVPLA